MPGRRDRLPDHWLDVRRICVYLVEEVGKADPEPPRCRTYDAAVEHHFKLKGEVTGIMAGQGGCESRLDFERLPRAQTDPRTRERTDECVNTKEALDSCGGCASTGEGRDCTKIRGAVGVGCEVGKCVVFSCKAGWRPALSGDKCVRAASYEGGRNATKAAGARRHMHRRRVSGHRNAAHLHS